jgi:glyoxylase-like metal-dependent hydrolase (beta-lactamase superfamily II)
MADNTIRIGNVEIMAVLDADATAPCTVLFPSVAIEDWQPHKQHLSEDGRSLGISIASYVIRSGGSTIIVDTGIGAKDRPFFPTGRLPDALREAGAPAESIDIVATTHIHIDHVGWHTTKQDDAYLPTFPKAKHLFNKNEYEYFTQPDIAQQNPHVIDCVMPLKDAADIELTSDEYKLTDEITLIQTPGHTPHHQSFVIRSGGESGILWGDVCHHPAQVTELWSPLFDMNPEQARATREQVLQMIEDENLQLIAGHFPFPGFGSIIRVDGKRYWRGR